MAATNINQVAISGNLTTDPVSRTTPGGLTIVTLRVANNTRRKVNDEWVDQPGFYDVTVFGAQGENAAKYLAKGRGVVVTGRLNWREWDDKDTGKKRQAVDIIADQVQFTGAPEGSSERGGAPAASDGIPF